ncbi:hypothetical protein LJC20_06740 [Eubacteriales bacterium OttesenSCG-928-M02]|nr:hypothetical protein [Eubacteriales bacterium OttesenSCG-928-M02]
MKKRIAIMLCLALLLSIVPVISLPQTASATDANITVSANDTIITITWDSTVPGWKAAATGGTVVTRQFGATDTLTIEDDGIAQRTSSYITIDGTGSPADAICKIILKDLNLQSPNTQNAIWVTDFKLGTLDLTMNNAQLSAAHGDGMNCLNAFDHNITITTIGSNNSLSGGNDSTGSYVGGYGLQAKNLVLIGEGSLTATGGNGHTRAGGAGIAASIDGYITIQSGTVTATGGKGGTVSTASFNMGGAGIGGAGNGVTIAAGASVTATGGEAGINGPAELNNGGYGVQGKVSLAGSLKATGGAKGAGRIGGNAVYGTVTFTDASAILQVQNGADDTSTLTAKRADSLKDTHRFILENGVTAASGSGKNQQIIPTPPSSSLGKITLLEAPNNSAITIEDIATAIAVTWDSLNACWKAAATGGTAVTKLFGAADTLTISGKVAATQYTGCYISIDGTGSSADADCKITLKDLKLQSPAQAGISAINVSNFVSTQKLDLGMNNAQLSSAEGTGYTVLNAFGQDVTITTTGSNSIAGGKVTSGGNDGSRGLYARNVVLKGTGRLAATGGDGYASDGGIGICITTGGSLNAESGTVVATGGKGGTQNNGSLNNGGAGIYNIQNTTIASGASVTAIGGEAGINGDPFGNNGGKAIRSDVLLAGSLTATGGAIGQGNGGGISAEGTITFTNASATLNMRNGQNNTNSVTIKRTDALKDTHIFNLENTLVTPDNVKDQQISVTPPIGSSGKIALLALYTVNSSSGTGGSISPSGNYVVKQGESIIYTITADKGYILDDITVDGKSMKSSVLNGKFALMVTGANMVYATFAPLASDSPKTGDNANIWWWVGIISLATVGFVCTVLWRRRTVKR